MKTRTRLVDHDHLSSWQEPNGKVLLRQPNSYVNFGDLSEDVARVVQRPTRRKNREAGQIVVEYVLLLVVAITAATLIVKAMISSDANNPGFVLSTWSKVIQAIGADHPDDIERSK